jgi:hypothetical protein
MRLATNTFGISNAFAGGYEAIKSGWKLEHYR